MQRALAPGLDGVEGVEEAVAAEIRLVHVVGAEEVLRAAPDVRDFDQRLPEELPLIRERPRVRHGRLEFGVDTRISAARGRRLQEVRRATTVGAEVRQSVAGGGRRPGRTTC